MSAHSQAVWDAMVNVIIELAQEDSDWDRIEGLILTALLHARKELHRQRRAGEVQHG